MSLPDEIKDAWPKEGRVITRFPPEPNGHLHIGHALAMENDFGIGDACYLRFDDTNPQTEKMEYVVAAREMVEWLGHKPEKITHSSDYFPELHRLAVKLIHQGDAYVCHLSSDDISLYRREKKPSPWRDRSVEANLATFEEMTNSTKWKPGEASLRMKGDLEDPDPCMWDLVLYRVITDTPHYRTGTQWRVYPSYDLTHCLVDSMEQITFSLCTTEFITRRKSYYWLIDKLGMHRPTVYEFGKASVSNNILSKRRLKQLVESGKLTGWDDPRLLTLAGLRRRGYTPSVIRKFISSGGFNRVDRMLPYHQLEQILREEMDTTVPRRFGVTDPIKVVIDEYGEELPTATLYDFPIHRTKIERGELDDVPENQRGTRTMRVTPTIWIDRRDAMDKGDKKYYGFTPEHDKIVRLKYTDLFLRCHGYTKIYGRLEEIRVSVVTGLTKGQIKKVKGVIGWVNAEGLPTEFRMYDRMYLEEAPEVDTPINPKSLVTVTGLVENLSPSDRWAGVRFQLERLGWFVVDPDSSDEKLVLNRSVSLRSSY